MLELVAPVALILGISSNDTIVLAGYILMLWAFLWFGIQKTYASFFGAIVGFSIYLVLRTLLLSATGSDSLFSPAVSKFLVGSSAYLILILAIITPFGNSIQVSGASNTLVRILENIAVTTGFLLFMFAAFFGFSGKTYIFDIDTFFILAKNSAAQAFFLKSTIFTWIRSEMRTIVVISVLFTIYKALFSEVIEAMVKAAWSAILRARKPASSPQPQEFHEEHDDGGDEFDEEEYHGHH